jgi:hypothetical protein
MLALTVRASRAGRVRARAKAKLGGRPKTVGVGAKRVSKGRPTVVRVKLSKLARHRLAQGKRLEIEVSVSMPGAIPRSKTVRLRRTER